MCGLDQVIVRVFQAYSVILFIYALISWLPDLRGPWVRYLAMLVEPVLAPVRRIIPPVGGLDMAFLVVIVLINFVIIPILNRAVFGACY
ncbi:MAG TPA: YggT family protein [Candidatus Acidoferrales bacterium]|nr:YggT family protein [Candidatus Acidoferrales bacterium]